MNELPRRMKTIESAKGFKEFKKQLEFFIGINNFSAYERHCIIHMLNSFYLMGADAEKSESFYSDNKGEV